MPDKTANRYFSRRSLLAGAATSVATGAVLAGTGPWVHAFAATPSLSFTEVSRVMGPSHAVAPGYRADVLIRWGDPVLAGAPAYAPGAVSVAAQEKQFGYNNDFIAYLPLPRGADGSARGLLCVSHEYTDPRLMWPGFDACRRPPPQKVAAEMAAHGFSVVEIARRGPRWHAVPGGRYARRVTATTPVHISGPAAGHKLLQTTADPTGRRVLGTINNCAGGVTPWGTVLSGEENYRHYFSSRHWASAEIEACVLGTLGARPFYLWHLYDRRFDTKKEPREKNRFGWVVEYDPYRPDQPPVKRTALGRFAHEGAATVHGADGRVTVYLGEDRNFGFLFKFTSRRPVDPENREANRDLLDDGTLSAARFNADGTLDWLPLVHGQGGLDATNKFRSQAEVLVRAHRAATVLGATPLDRPEDVEASPTTGRVYVMLTGSRKRSATQIDAASSRGPNPHGHVLELIPPGDGPRRDHGARGYRWQVFLLAGDPQRPAHAARYHPDVSPNGWISAPDNCAFDPGGRMWITTDAKGSNGVFACETTGPNRALTRLFYRAPWGAECSGPAFTPDGRTLFVSVQHPGAGSAFETPSTRWPDFRPDMPPRPAVVAITREDGGEIGG